MTIRAKVYHQEQLIFSTDLDGPLEIGRQRQGEPSPCCRMATDDGVRVIVAAADETKVSRRLARLDTPKGNQLPVTNLSRNSKVLFQPDFPSGPSPGSNSDTVEQFIEIGPGVTRHVPMPGLLLFADKVIRLEEAPQEEQLYLETLHLPTVAPGQEFPAESLMSTPTAPPDDPDASAVTPELLVDWLRRAMRVLESAANAPDFLAKAAQTVAGIVGLDCAAALRCDGGQWSVVAVGSVAPSGPPPRWEPSQTMLDRVRDEKRTFRHVPKQLSSQSLMGVKSLVAAPILDREGVVIGAIYGDRRRARKGLADLEITEIEAMLVELVACGVAAGLARLEQEQVAARARVQFEQFFTPELARQLEAEPDLLTGRDAEVSVLFCDIRRFSRLSEKLGPATTMEWIGDVMGTMSDAVLRHSGVLVDYVGDELIAMWGAPAEQPDHAKSACRAAMDILQQLPALNSRWQETLGEPIRVGIGINTGQARVGNTGSVRKFKYGPLGNTVNLASRVQGATKFAKTDLLITDATAKQLDDSFYIRRLCCVRVVNIEEPTDLYEVVSDGDEHWLKLKREYESALGSYQQRDFRTAAKILGSVLTEFPEDGPSLLLLSHSVNALANENEVADTVWTLQSK